MLAPRRSSLDRLPLLTVMGLATSLVVWAALGTSDEGTVLAGLEAGQPARGSTGTLPALRPSDVPGLSNEPSQLLGELLSLSLPHAGADPLRSPAELGTEGADPSSCSWAQVRRVMPST